MRKLLPKFGGVNGGYNQSAVNKLIIVVLEEYAYIKSPNELLTDPEADFSRGRSRAVQNFGRCVNGSD